MKKSKVKVFLKGIRKPLVYEDCSDADFRELVHKINDAMSQFVRIGDTVINVLEISYIIKEEK